jgi:hypothetical protein
MATGRARNAELFLKIRGLSDLHVFIDGPAHSVDSPAAALLRFLGAHPGVFMPTGSLPLGAADLGMQVSPMPSRKGAP